MVGRCGCRARPILIGFLFLATALAIPPGEAQVTPPPVATFYWHRTTGNNIVDINVQANLMTQEPPILPTPATHNTNPFNYPIIPSRPEQPFQLSFRTDERIQLTGQDVEVIWHASYELGPLCGSEDWVVQLYSRYGSYTALAGATVVIPPTATGAITEYRYTFPSVTMPDPGYLIAVVEPFYSDCGAATVTYYDSVTEPSRVEIHGAPLIPLPKTIEFYFHGTTRVNPVDVIADTHVMDQTPPINPVGVAHPHNAPLAGGNGETIYDMSFITDSQLVLNCVDIRVVWYGEYYTDFLFFEDWEVALYEASDNVNPIASGAWSFPYTIEGTIAEHVVTFPCVNVLSPERLILTIDMVYLDSGNGATTYYDGQLFPSRMEFDVGSPPPPPPLAVDAQGPYTGNTTGAARMDGLATGGYPSYICRWSGPPEVSFYDRSDCRSPATASKAGDYLLRLNVTDSSGAFGTDTAWFNVTDPKLPDRPDPPPSGPNDDLDRDSATVDQTNGAGGSSQAWRNGAQDQDLDGRADTDDVCATMRDEGEDTDGDGVGDACDPDVDGDGVSNDRDNCKWTPNPLQEGAFGDGRGDACQPDTDGDGIIDEVDLCVTEPDPDGDALDQDDLDGDGRGDACDLDRDGDGVPDEIDACPDNPRGWTNTDNDPNDPCDQQDRDIDNDGFTNDEERLAGTDPYDDSSYPQDLARLDVTDADGQVASISLGASLGLLLLLVVVGIGLFALLRPRP